MGVTAYTMRQVAEMLQVSERTVKNLVASGELDSLKVGRLRRITQAQFNKYTQAQPS